MLILMCFGIGGFVYFDLAYLQIVFIDAYAFVWDADCGVRTC